MKILTRYKKRKALSRALWAGLLLLGVSSTVRAAGLPAALSPEKARHFEAQKSKLDQRRLDIDRAVQSFNSQCGQVPENDTAQIQKCREWQKELLDRAREYQADLAAYKSELLDAIDEELAAIDQRLPKTRAEIEKVSDRLKGYQASLSEWAGLPVKARDKARETAKFTVATLLTQTLMMRKQKKIDLNKDMVKRIDGLMRRRILDEPNLLRLPGMREKTLERLLSLKSDQEALEILSAVQKGMQALTVQEIRNNEEMFTAMLRVIDLINRDPRIALLIADGEIWIDAAYGWWAGREAGERIDQLLDLGDQQLKGLKSLTDLYKSDIDKRTALLKEKTKLAP